MSGEIYDDSPELSGLLFGASERYRTVRAKVLTTVEASTAREANRRYVDWQFRHGGKRSMGIIGKPGPPSRENFYNFYRDYESKDYESVEVTGDVLFTWHERPDRWREERRAAEGELLSCTVAAGGGGPWWVYDPPDTAIYIPAVLADERPDMYYSFMLDPSEELFRETLTDDAIMYKTGREATVAGRKALEAKVGTVSWGYLPQILPGSEAFMEGTTDHLLMVDAEVGTILRVAARLEGREFRVAEVTEVAYDEAFPEDTFRLDLPGVQVRRKVG